MHDAEWEGRSVKNPFQYGRELGADSLVDRQKEINEVTAALTEGGKLFLIGPRRYGKTSILKVSAERVEQSGGIVLRFDAEAYPTLELLVRAILAEATARLAGNLKQAGDWARKFFGRLRPEITYHATEGTFSARLGASLEVTDAPTQVPLLVELLNGLENLAATSKGPVGLIIDEFQKIIELAGESAEGQIRAAIQKHAHVGYVFAGSKTRMMADMTGNPARPFYHLGERRFLGPVPRDEFAAFLKQGFEDKKVKTDEEALQLIIDLAEEVPYNIQRLAHACWNALDGRRGGDLTTEVVRASLEQLLREDDTFYTQLWNQLTVVQKKALVAAVREGGVELLSHRVTRAHNLSAPSLSRALGALQEKELLRTEESQGKSRLRLVDPFFGAWITLIS
jgi:uncharacterized protein